MTKPDFFEKPDETREDDRHSERRAKKFTWEPADVKVQDENGNWIRGDEFLRRLKRDND